MISDYGAIGDGKTLNTQAIQMAIDACSDSGGGRVIIPPGVFLSGTLWLKDFVELHLSSANSVLLASANHDDYNKADAFPQNAAWPHEQMNGGHFIIGVEVKSVSITGYGTINGNGHSFFTDKLEWTYLDTYCYWPHGFSIIADLEKTRPGQMIYLCECRNVHISGVTMCNTPFWTFLAHGCENVQIHGIRIENDETALNSDGIDIDCCRNVAISDCIIETGDDALAIRANNTPLKNKDMACENLTVTNCILSSGGANAIRIGVGHGIIRNVLFSNLIFHDSVGGVHFQSKYSTRVPGPGTSISNIQFHNVRGTNIRIPFFINSGFDATAMIEDIVFDGYRCDMKHTLGVFGNQFTTLRNITFNNIELTVTGRLKGVENHEVDCSEYGTHSRCLDCALYFAHVQGVSLNNFQLKWKDADPGWKYGAIVEPSAEVNISENSNINCFFGKNA